jgi:hypothetical protein
MWRRAVWYTFTHDSKTSAALTLNTEIFYPVNKGNIFLSNVGKFVPVYTASYLGRQ